MMPDEPDASVFIGQGPINNYLLEALSKLTEFDRVWLKARGKDNIGSAVIVGEMMRNDHGCSLEVFTGTDTKAADDGSEYKVTSLEILAKKNK